MRIIDGIYQLLTPFPQFTIADAKALRHDLQEHPRVTKGLPYVLPYLLKDGDDTVLVDCGWNTDTAYQALEEGMKEHGSHPNDINKLVVTHVHPDHYGMAGRLKQLSSCEIVLHEKDAEVITARYFAPKGLMDEMGKFMETNGVPAMDTPTMARGSMGMLGNVAPVPADTEVLFCPDQFLGAHVRRLTNRTNMHIWAGECHVHAGINGASPFQRLNNLLGNDT